MYRISLHPILVGPAPAPGFRLDVLTTNRFSVFAKCVSARKYMTIRLHTASRRGRGGLFPYILSVLLPGFFFYIWLLKRYGMPNNLKPRRLIERTLDIGLAPVGWVLDLVRYAAIVAAMPLLGIAAVATWLHPRTDRAEFEARRRRTNAFLRGESNESQ